MEIIIAENSGLCYGVKRALNIARRTRRAVTGPVSTLGDLIHNPRVIADLRACGVRSAAAARDIEGGTVIIRSHGVSPAIYRALARKNLEIVDATCPIVKKIQKLVESLARKNMEVIIIGDREHAEIRGLIGYSRSRGIIVENEAQARELPCRKTRAAVAQSTLDVELFERVVAALAGRTGELSVHNTICRFTRARQTSTSELASRVDTLFIVGGRASSNTRKLYRISKRILPRTFFIETADEITPGRLRGARTIGISGGASTPPEALQEATARIKASFEHKIQREKSVP
jgi:4-hydroxy-3-methylbut-2-enyl diphosphate reductase